MVTDPIGTQVMLLCIQVCLSCQFVALSLMISLCVVSLCGFGVYPCVCMTVCLEMHVAAMPV